MCFLTNITELSIVLKIKPHFYILRFYRVFELLPNQDAIQQLYIVHFSIQSIFLQYKTAIISHKFFTSNMFYITIEAKTLSKKENLFCDGVCATIFSSENEWGDVLTSWMKNLSDDLKISRINLPGTHNSCAKRVQFSYLSKCHDLSICEQLNIGVRFLDIRVELCENKLITVHSIADCYTPYGKRKRLLIDQVLADCKKFLKENPTEAIILCVKRDDGPSSEETFDLFYEKFLKNDPYWFTENRIPTLGEVRGKLVLFNRCGVDFSNPKYTDFNTGLRLSNWPDLPKNAEICHSEAPIYKQNNTFEEAYILQDMYKLFPKEKWYRAVLPLLENPPQKDCLFMNYFTAANFFNSPRQYARFILGKFKKFPLKSNIKYGWLIFDFPTRELCERVISTNF